VKEGHPCGLVAAPRPEPEGLPIRAFTGCVPGEWIDENGHVSSMAYPALFHSATAVLFNLIGISKQYVVDRRLTIFQREYRIVFERELLEDNYLEIRSYLAGYNDRRMRHFHELWNVSAGYRAATVEYLSVHVDLATRRSAPFPADIASNLAMLSQRFSQVLRPNGIGARIELGRGDAFDPGG